MSNIDIYAVYLDKSHFIYCYSNNSDGGAIKCFEITSFESQLSELLDHLETLNGQICFNGLRSDYQILDDIIQSKAMYLESNPSMQLSLLNNKVKQLAAKDAEFVNERNFFISQIDLSKLLGLNTAIRTTDISDIAKVFGISFPDNGKEISKSRNKGLYTNFSADDIKRYLNLSIETIIELYKYVCGFNNESPIDDLIITRTCLYQHFRVALSFNMSDIKVGEVIACKLWCKLNNTDLKSFPKPALRAYNQKVGDIIPNEYTFFKNEDFNRYIKYLDQTDLTPSTKLDFRIVLGDMYVKLGNGGMHGSIEPGIYDSTSDTIILTQDITSYFASVCCFMKYYPAHLNDFFVDVYKRILDTRLEIIERAGNKCSASIMLKNMLVGIYGKFKEEQSNLYDPTLQLKIAVMAQIFTMWWIDELTTLANAEILSVNTDGVIFRVSKSRVNMVKQTTKKLLDKFGFHIKESEICRLYLKDTNNYMYTTPNSSIVKVGCFDDSFNIYRTVESRNTARCILDHFFTINGDETALRRKYGDAIMKAVYKVIYQITETQTKLF